MASPSLLRSPASYGKGFFFRLGLLGMADALGVYALAVLIDSKAWGFVGALVVGLATINFVYLSKRTRASRWILPGVLLMGAFVVWPIAYSFYISVTNWSTGNILTQAQVIEQVESIPNLAAAGEGVEYDLSVYRDGSGSIRFWVETGDGQVFFVHNRVHDIEAVAARLQRIVPEATLSIGHGQMPESQLEEVMPGFVNHQFDILPATPILESGLDIPNANTIFIDDADRYGLADLHQLRGRVGRYKHRAYCYLLIDENRHLSPEAARRLRAIEEFSQMGAGFAIAMRDLELRGAGNLLGTQQSGHIATVGYELYCTLLDRAVRELKKLPAKEMVDVSIDLPVQAFFPRKYVTDMRTKIDLYRRLARLTTEAELDDFAGELADRFGPLPDLVQRLVELARVRIWAHRWQVNSAHVEDRYLVLGFSDRAQIGILRQQSGDRLRIVDDQSAYLPLGKGFKDDGVLVSELKSLLQPEGSGH